MPGTGEGRRRSVLVAVAFVWAVLTFAPGAGAQEGAVEGRVRDDEGSVVRGAVVELLRQGRRVRAAETDALGFFRMGGLSAGPATLRVSGLGYAPSETPVGIPVDGVVELPLVVARRAIEVEGIEVEAERSRERIRFEEVGGATVRELELEDLKAVPGIAEADPLRAVEVLPGVVSTSDFTASFNVRGGSADQNLILLDGVPIFSPFHLGGLFSVFNADMLRRAELQSGGFAAEHGGRVSSVLDIESDPGNGSFQADAGVSLLASRLALATGLPEGTAEGLGFRNVRARFSARRSYFDVLLKPFLDFPYHLTDLQGVVEGWTAAGDRLTLTAYSGEDVLDFTRLDPEDFPLRVDWDWGNDLVGLRWTRPRDGGGSLDLRANASRFSTGLTFPDFQDTDFSSAIRQAQLRGELEARPAGEWRTKLGGQVQHYAYDNLATTGGTEFNQGDGTGTLLAGFGQAVWRDPGRWLVEAGVRLDHWRPDPGEAISEWSPRVAVKRFFSDGDGAVKLAAGRYTQFLHSLRDEELPLGLDIWVLSGARAPHVVSDQLQLGVEGYPGGGWFLSGEAYVRGFDGVVALNSAEDPNDPLDDILAGDGLSYGLDLMARRETGPVTGWLAVSLLRAERTFVDALSPFDPPPEVAFPPIFDRRLDVDLVLRFPLLAGWTGGLRWNLGTGTPYTRPVGSFATYAPSIIQNEGRLNWDGADGDRDDRGGFAVLLEDRNRSRYPVYHRLDLSARKSWNPSWGTVTPYVNLVNAYNQRNVLFYFFQYEERPPTRSGVSMFPVLPTFGLEIRF